MTMKEIKATIEFITPVHVGSGETITPLDYYIKDGKLHKLNFNKFISTLGDKVQDLMDVLNRNDFAKLRTFAEEYAKAEAIDYSIPVSSKVAKEYNEKKTDNNNRLEISIFPYDGVTRHPYIPGSSIKGAFRTALLESLIEQMLVQNSSDDGKIRNWIEATRRDETGNQFEGKLLGYKDIHRDIFRVLKVFDVPLSAEDTEVVQCKNFTPGRSSDIPMRLQVTKSQISALPKIFKKDLVLVWDEELKESKIKEFDKTTQQAIPKPLFQKKFTLQELGNACNAHYFRVLYWEYEKFYKENTDPIFNILKGLYKNIKENQFLIRLGRFGHVESKTFDKYREPSAKKGWGRSRTKANDTFPLGWAVITILDMKFTKPSEDELKEWKPTGKNQVPVQRPNQNQNQNQKPRNIQNKSKQQKSHSPKEQKNQVQQQRTSQSKPFSQQAPSKNSNQSSGYNPFAKLKQDKKEGKK